jgi:signal peptidase I
VRQDQCNVGQLQDKPKGFVSPGSLVESNLMENVNNLRCDLAAEVASRFGRVLLRVVGWSMAPAIHPGDLIYVQRIGVTEVLPGDIVVFAREGRLVVHRVTTITSRGIEPCLVTRGDRTRRNDDPICNSALIGRVTNIVRGNGQIRPLIRLGRRQRMVGRLLRTSHRAICLYVRLAKWRGKITSSRSSGPKVLEYRV